MKVNPSSARRFWFRSGMKRHDENGSSSPADIPILNPSLIVAGFARIAAGLLLAQPAQALSFADFKAFYQFNSSSGHTTDSSGNGRDLTWNGAPAYSNDGQFNESVKLDGTNSLTLANFASSGFPAGNSSYTVAFWVKPDPTCPKDADIVGWGLNVTSQRNFTKFGDNERTINNYWWFSDFTGKINGGSFFDNQFHLVVTTWDLPSRTRKIYLDGLEVSTKTLGSAETDPAVVLQNFKIGGSFKGEIDNLGIASRAISAQEVKSLLNRTLETPNPDISVSLTGSLSLVNDKAVGGMAGNGTIQTSSTSPLRLYTGFGNADASFSGILSSANIQLTKMGTGTQTLVGGSRETKSTSIQGGALVLDGGTYKSKVDVSTGTTFGAEPTKFGGTGIVDGNVTLMKGSCPIFSTTGPLEITGSLTLNNNIVRLRLPTNGYALPPNNSTQTIRLCKFKTSGSSGEVAVIPEIDSGYFADHYKYSVVKVAGSPDSFLDLVVMARPANTSIAGINVYPAVPKLAPSNKYSVRIRRTDNPNTWNSAFVFQTKAQTKYPDHLYYGTLENWSHSYINFEMIQPYVSLEVEITKNDGGAFTENPIVRPANRVISATRSPDNKSLLISLNKPCNISVDIDKQMEGQDTGNGAPNPVHTLSIHANPAISDKPSDLNPNVLTVEPGIPPALPLPADKSILYFKPGIHRLGIDVKLAANKQYYIPGDAIVHATFNNYPTSGNANGSNIRIFGHGTISGEEFKHWRQIDPSGITSYQQRPIDILQSSNTKLEGITLADSANNSILVPSASDDPNRINEVTWVKIFTWRTNGDGGGCSTNSNVNNCFMRTQDDGLYVNGHNVSDVVLWTDVNGSPMRMSHLPNLTNRVLEIKNIDVIYSRSNWWSKSSAMALPGEDATSSNRGAGVVFSNINVSDPFPNGNPITFTQNSPTSAVSLGGIRFENVTFATNTNSAGKKIGLHTINQGRIDNITFHNLVIANTLVTSQNQSDYFESYSAPAVTNIKFTSPTGTTPKVSVTRSSAFANEQPSTTTKFTFSRTGSTALPLTVEYLVTGGATNGTDYSIMTGSVTIPGGQPSADVNLNVQSDTAEEGREDVVVILKTLTSNPVAYDIASPSNATITILDTSKPADGSLGRSRWSVTSSIGAGHYAAVDPDGNSRWTTNDTQTSNQWFQIDLDVAQWFNRIVIVSKGGDHAPSCEVHVSNLGDSWTSSVPIAVVPGAHETTTITFPIQNARYIRLVQKGASANNWWSINDIKVYGSLDRSAWTPSASVGGSAGSAIDGNSATRWTTNANQAPGQWFQINLKDSIMFDKIYLDTKQSNGQSYDDFPIGYQVLVSDTDTAANWTALTPVQSGVGTSQLTKISFDPVKAQYIRIRQTSTSLAPPNNKWWSIVEMFVFPKLDHGISSPWSVKDIGPVGLDGVFSASGGKWMVGAAGADIWQAPDSFRYVYQSFSGNNSVSSKVSKIVSTDAWARSGVMMRESDGTGANYAMLCWTTGNGLQFQWRNGGTGSGNVRIQQPADPAQHHLYLKIVRVGTTTFKPQTSPDGVAWSDCMKHDDGSVIMPVTVNMSQTNVLRGLIVCSHQGPPSPVLKAGTFEGVSLNP